MRIKAQFIISMLVFGIILALIGVSMMATARQVARLDTEQEIAVAIGSGVGDLAYLTGDYLLYQEDQQRARWETKWESVSADVARLTPSSAGERALRDQLVAELESMKTVFGEAVQQGDATPAAGEPGEGPLFQIYWSRLVVQNQTISFDVLRLSRVLRDQELLVSQRSDRLTAVLLAAFGVFFFVNYLIVVRRALADIASLRAGTRIVGTGNLDYAIPATRNDEIGELTRAFNRMTADLKEVITSRTHLEREVAEREKAEVALRNGLKRIAELSDARDRELDMTKRLLGAAEALAEWTDLAHILGTLADIVLESTVHRRVTIQLWDEVKRELQTVVVRGDVDSYPVPEVLAWDDLSASGKRAVETLDSAVIDYEALPVAERGLLYERGARLGLAVPLVYRQRLVGLVRVDDPGERREFDEREIALIQGLAAQAAVAIENGRLYDAERQTADALRSIFQRPAPEIAGVELGVAWHYASMAARVGGDFYDAFALGDEVAILVGDVAGKGLAAVGMTERVRSAVRSLAYAGNTVSPAYLLNKANDSIVREMQPGEFVTAVLITVNSVTGAYRLARAGHPLPVVCGRSCQQLETPGGPPLGLFEGRYEEMSGVLAQDETIVLYTDGVIEARRDAELYGEERLLEFLAEGHATPAVLADQLFTNVQEFARGILSDDLLIVAVRLASGTGS